MQACSKQMEDGACTDHINGVSNMGILGNACLQMECKPFDGLSQMMCGNPLQVPLPGRISH